MKNQKEKKGSVPAKGQPTEKREGIDFIPVVYDDGESISCRTAPQKPFGEWPMPRD